MRSFASTVVALAIAWPALADAPLSERDVDAIGRVVYAEAGNQPVAGKVAVLDTILNRLASGRFGGSVGDVIEQRNAFEPVTRAGGWRNLPPLTEVQRVEFGTIIGLKASGHLGDVSAGALYFQNPKIVAARADAGTVRKDLIGFGGMPVTAAIADHTFYAPGGSTAARAPSTPISGARHPTATLFVGSGEEEEAADKPETILLIPGDR